MFEYTSLKNAVAELKKTEDFISSDWQQDNVGQSYRTYHLHPKWQFGLEHTPKPAPITPSLAAVAAMKKFNEKEILKTSIAIQVEVPFSEAESLIRLLMKNGYL